MGGPHSTFSVLGLFIFFPVFFLIAGKALVLPSTVMSSLNPVPFQDVGPGSLGAWTGLSPSTRRLDSQDLHRAEEEDFI